MENVDQVSNLSGDVSNVTTPKEIQETEAVPENFLKLLAQRKSDMVKLREYEKKLSLFEEQDRIKREEEQRNRGEFDKILKSREEEIEAYKKREKQIHEELRIEHSKQAFLSLLPGKLANPDYLNLIPVNQIKYNADGDIDMKNLESLVENWKKSHFRLIDMPGSSAQLPNHSAERKKGLTHAEWLKLPIKEKKIRIGEVID